MLEYCCAFVAPACYEEDPFHREKWTSDCTLQALASSLEVDVLLATLYPKDPVRLSVQGSREGSSWHGTTVCLIQTSEHYLLGSN